MAYEQRDNSGTLFRNNNKKEDKHPDYTGAAMIGGVMMKLSAWIKRPANPGQATFMSIAFKPKDEQTKPAQQHQPQPDINEQDVPF